MKAAMRELEEEMHITQNVKLEHIGFINDDESEVGKVHLGFVMQAWLDNPDAAVREDALSKGEWVKQQNMVDGNEYETWSQLIIEGYLQ
jgi:predicted NUDIX family phosphoesterase